jgi:hypothetical protein
MTGGDAAACASPKAAKQIQCALEKTCMNGADATDMPNLIPRYSAQISAVFVRQQKGQAHQVGGGDGVEASRNGLPSMGLRESGRVEVLLAGRAELLHDAVHGTVPAPV